MTGRGDTALYHGVLAGLAALWGSTLIVALSAELLGFEPGRWVCFTFALAPVTGAMTAFLSYKRKHAGRETDRAAPGAPAAEPSNLLCPECGYDQRGLPIVHRCPECGYSFRERVLVWRSANWGMRIVVGAVVGQCLFLCLFMNPLMRGLMIVFPEWVALTAALLLIVLAPTTAAYRVYKSNRRGRFLAIMPAGLWMRTVNGDFYIPWEDVSIIAVHDLPPSIKRRGAEAPISIQGIFRNTAEAKAFDAAARAAMARRTSGTPA